MQMNDPAKETHVVKNGYYAVGSGFVSALWLKQRSARLESELRRATIMGQFLEESDAGKDQTDRQGTGEG